ncbi:MAG: thiamine-phosphate kinase [Dehalococcoidales bacterium]|nr:thiamine-phosphate kinase [Dehalococcoidales bacterium]
MKVSALGEFGLVERIGKLIDKSRDTSESWQKLILGVGDDTAAWQGDDSIQLAKVDALVEGIHFRHGMMSWEDLGWKALAINLSDIAAMGGIPKYALVSLAVPPDIEVDDVLALYKGMLKLAQRFGLAIIGGDTDSAPRISVTVTVLGSMGKSKDLLTRNTAKPGDLIAVTGYLGSAATGYEIIHGKTKNGKNHTAAKKAFLRPEPRLTEGQLLLKYGIKTAIDVSDGLLSDLRHICKASRVSARLEAVKIPIAPEVAAAFGKKALLTALSGGEDYELLFTGKAEAIEKAARKAACSITVIGEIIAGKDGVISVVDEAGKPLKLSEKGWEHFVSK